MRASPDDAEVGIAPADGEVSERIRAVYNERARRPAQGRHVAEAYRRLNADRRRRTMRLLGQLLPGVAHPRLLDVGCGGGLDLAAFRDAGWPVDRLAGTDLMADRVAIARERVPDVDIHLSDGTDLPWPDSTFDVVTAVTVLSSIRDRPTQRALAREMARVTRQGGVVLVYDFVVRKPGNRDVVALPMRALCDLLGKPTGSLRLSPMLYAIAAGAAVHPKLADLAERVAPPTHRLTFWRVQAPGVDAARSSSDVETTGIPRYSRSP